MLHTTRTILGNAGILSAILDHDMAYVNMTNYISMHGDVLSDHKSVEKYREQNKKTNINIWKTCRMRNALCILELFFAYIFKCCGHGALTSNYIRMYGYVNICMYALTLNTRRISYAG